jgi:hypothetical protein
VSPDTVHVIAQEIRHRRALLTVDEHWWQQQPKSPTRDEGFRRINFWRRVLKEAEQQLAVGELEEIAS